MWQVAWIYGRLGEAAAAATSTNNNNSSSRSSSSSSGRIKTTTTTTSILVVYYYYYYDYDRGAPHGIIEMLAAKTMMIMAMVMTMMIGCSVCRRWWW